MTGENSNCRRKAERCRFCTEQAFFNLDSRCIFRYSFCNCPLLKKGEDKSVSTEDMMKMLDKSFREYGVKAVSFTGAVADSVRWHWRRPGCSGAAATH